MSIVRRRVDVFENRVDFVLVVDRAFERAADGDSNQSRAGRVKLTAQVGRVHLSAGQSFNNAGFHIENVAQLLNRIVRLGGNVQNRGQVGFRRQIFSTEIQAVHVAVCAAVGNEPPPGIGGEPKRLGVEIDNGAFELVDVEHVPRLFIRAADADQRCVAQPRFDKPFIESFQIRFLIERVSHLIASRLNEPIGGFGQMV